MENAIWTTIYDFPKEDRDEYLRWFHEDYIPEALLRKGYVWAAHYQLIPIRVQVVKIGRSNAPALPGETGFAILYGGESTRTFLNPNPSQIEKSYAGKTREMMGLRIRPVTYLHTVEWRTEGPESDREGSTGMPAAFIQMGFFDASGHDEDLGTWYARERMHLLSHTPGVRVRKLLATVGLERHSVLYDFRSLELRKKHLVPLEETELSLRLYPHLIHPPGSPVLGSRIWPPE